uniref:Neur_chan_LBD domain-containing protein n=1 Tax=Strongyloides papillosus TaxID=174720 RepID=A0A0N5CHI6_STREA
MMYWNSFGVVDMKVMSIFAILVARCGDVIRSRNKNLCITTLSESWSPIGVILRYSSTGFISKVDVVGDLVLSCVFRLTLAKFHIVIMEDLTTVKVVALFFADPRNGLMLLHWYNEYPLLK